MTARLIAAASLLCACAAGAAAQGTPELKNWFDDPFFQVSHAVSDCPLPAGPLITEAERRVQSHHRAEKGTTCWLAKQCDRPNYYAYDREIAEGAKAALASSSLIAGTSLWVTVQGRIVFIEGCAPSEALGLRIEALLRKDPNVQQAISALYTPPRTGRPPYRLLPPAPR
jgi:BON domain